MYASTSAHKVAYQPLTASPNFIDLRGVGHKRALWSVSDRTGSQHTQKYSTPETAI